MKKFMRTIGLLTVLAVGGVFTSCDKNDAPVDPMSIKTKDEVRSSTTEARAIRWSWNWLLDEEFFPEASDRWTGVSIPAGETKYVKFRVSKIGKYRIALRHSTVGVSLRVRRYRGSSYLVGKNLPGSTDESFYIETNGTDSRYQGSSADGDIMKLEIENTSNTDVNDLIVNWSPFFYGSW